MVAPTFTRLQRRLWPAAAVLGGALLAPPAHAQSLTGGAFQIQYGASGLASLKRTADVADTDYIAPNARLGPLIVRYRTTPNGDWKELRDLIETKRSRAGVTYELCAFGPTLASRASGSAVQGVAGLRGLNDGRVPSTGRGGRGAGAAGPDMPIFTWSPARGATQWVQYTFPDEQTIGHTEVFWTRPRRRGGCCINRMASGARPRRPVPRRSPTTRPRTASSPSISRP